MNVALNNAEIDRLIESGPSVGTAIYLTDAQFALLKEDMRLHWYQCNHIDFDSFKKELAREVRLKVEERMTLYDPDINELVSNLVSSELSHRLYDELQKRQEAVSERLQNIITKSLKQNAAEMRILLNVEFDTDAVPQEQPK